MFVLRRACAEVYIHQSIELIHHDLDIVSPIPCESADALTVVGAGDRAKLPALHAHFDAVEVACDFVHTFWISAYHELVAYLFRFDM